MEGCLIRALAFIVAIVPAFVILSYFMLGARVRFDVDMVWTAFGFGAGAAFPAVMISKLYELAVGHGDGLYQLAASEAFFGAAVPEETCKLIALIAACARQWRELKANHLFALAVAVAAGFACFENIFYVVEGSDWGATAALRSVSAVPGHAFVGAVMGVCIIQAIHGAGPHTLTRFLWWGLALLFPIVLHGSYNFPLMALSSIDNTVSDTPKDLAQVLVYFFIVIVIVEGAIAHICMRIALNRSDTRTHDSSAAVGSGPVRWLQTIGAHPLLWASLGMGCLLGAGALFWGLSVQADIGVSLASPVQQSLTQGFATFSALHGVAFIGLAVFLRRTRLSSNDPMACG